MDQSGADEKAGLSFDYIYAGAHKIDGNPHAPLTNQARAALQEKVDKMHVRFANQVAVHRNIPVSAIRATEARRYMGELAVRAGLADQLGTLTDALAAADQRASRPAGAVPRAAAAAPAGPIAAGLPAPATKPTTPMPPPRPPAPAPSPAARAAAHDESWEASILRVCGSLRAAG